MTKEQISNYTRRISEANATQMITILYEMTLDYLRDAKKSLLERDYDTFERELTKAQNCISELMRSLNTKYGIANTFMQLYIFSKRHLVSAGIRRDVGFINDVINIFVKMRDCYRELEKLNQAASVITGAQQVFAGLTYSPGHLNEIVTDPYTNRGYRA
ncbi:flagellar protein FliS [Butyrivibrio fibrisolvens DSM 3071]|jgi:flagellar protein FliS|uniref:Flagellar protein FliS n=1 Tax=Butyrivibrio fibrisolvens DSM 3071 TaxID=1121131 RepID=A0A1M5ZP16_BUTFI|nr:flagellar export chaperone FliS [Butyrivibrio fibrisolvens]SHI25941.1 flagellar protein FliS [Butyrivibrio fibrisolvens DSM 3071]